MNEKKMVVKLLALRAKVAKLLKGIDALLEVLTKG